MTWIPLLSASKFLRLQGLGVGCIFPTDIGDYETFSKLKQLKLMIRKDLSCPEKKKQKQEKKKERL